MRRLAGLDLCLLVAPVLNRMHEALEREFPEPSRELAIAMILAGSIMAQQHGVTVPSILELVYRFKCGPDENLSP